MKIDWFWVAVIIICIAGAVQQTVDHAISAGVFNK